MQIDEPKMLIDVRLWKILPIIIANLPEYLSWIFYTKEALCSFGEEIQPQYYWGNNTNTEIYFFF